VGLLFVSFLLLLVVPVLMSHLIAGMSRSAAGMQWMAMDEELSLDPEVAYKTAQVLVAVDGRSAILSGVTEGRSYTVDAEAACKRPNCQPPGLDCVCGFYAFRSYGEAARMLGRTIGYYGVRPTALLTVELEGEVLEYERGFRAQHQRVVSVGFTLGCDMCERFEVHRDAVCLAASSTFVPRRFTGLGNPTVALPGGYVPVRPVCEQHIPHDPDAQLLDPGELGRLLGTEVTWLETPGQAGVAA
jgi:hypothetical protein